MLPVEGNAPKTGTTVQELQTVLMGGKRMLHNTVGGRNLMGGATRKKSAPKAGQQQGVERGSKGWSALTEAVKMFGPAATMYEFSKNY